MQNINLLSFWVSDRVRSRDGHPDRREIYIKWFLAGIGRLVLLLQLLSATLSCNHPRIAKMPAVNSSILATENNFTLTMY
jgi:hypothetical protein